jgi:hypothetical protein
MEKHRNVIQLRVSPEERQAIETQAQAHGLGISEWLRKAGTGTVPEPQPLPPPGFRCPDDCRLTQVAVRRRNSGECPACGKDCVPIATADVVAGLRARLGQARDPVADLNGSGE